MGREPSVSQSMATWLASLDFDSSRMTLDAHNKPSCCGHSSSALEMMPAFFPGLKLLDLSSDFPV